MIVLTGRSEGALRLRAWALEHLSAGNEMFPDPPPVTPGAWDLFLRVERAALLLGGVAPAAAASNRIRLREAQQTLSARHQLRLLDQVATELAVPIIALKSGRHLAEGGPEVGANDLDFLVPVTAAPRVAQALEGRGYRPMGDDLPGHHHLPPLQGGEMLPIEIHTRLKGLGCGVEELLDEAAPLPGWSSLLGLRPDHHLWHLLVHGVVQHPFRRGRLRDLAMIAAAGRACSQEQRLAVASRAAAHPMRHPLEAQWRLAAGRSDGDPFRTAAAISYVVFDRPRLLKHSHVLGMDLTNAAVRADAGEVESVAGGTGPVGPVRSIWRRLRSLVIGVPSRLLVWKIRREARRAS